MRFLVRPGERIAADGVVTEGHSAVDTSIVTGEAVPREVDPGDEVTGGMLNTHGSLVVEARRVGADGTLAQVVRLVSEALSRKAPIQRLADRISAVFVPAVVVVAAATLVTWLLLGSVGAAISPAVAVLIVACPCALGLATPAAFMAGSGRGARMGVIIRGPDALEAARRIDVVALDKTGTVTEGHLEVVAVEVIDGTDAGSLLAAAAALEARSEHPVAAAIVRAARRGSVDGVESDGLRPDDPEPAVADFRNLPGFGVQGRLVRTGAAAGSASGRTGSGGAGTDEGSITVGRAELFEQIPAALERATADHVAAGRTLVFVGANESARGFLALADRVKPSSSVAVADWKRAGIEVVLLSGDNSAAAEQVGLQVGDRPRRRRTDACRQGGGDRAPADRRAARGDGG